MKKRTFYAIAASVILSTTIISCGSDSTESKEVVVEEVVAEVKETVEEVAEEVVAEVSTINGEDFFTTSGCVACHQVGEKTVGPSITTISTSYSDNKNGILAFLKGEAEPIVDPAMAAVMAPQVEITKAMTDDERNALAGYILSK